MLQPFEIFKEEYIQRLKVLKKIYLVTQTYHRIPDKQDRKISILISDYDDIGLAKIHLAAISSDKYAAVINLEKINHVAKITKMLANDSLYDLYWAVVRDAGKLKKTADKLYKDKIRSYILKKTTWRISADESIKTQLQVVFGEIYITIKRGTQELRIKFEEIEKE